MSWLPRTFLTFAAATLSVACFVDSAEDSADESATSELSVSALSGKQLRATRRTAPFRFIAFEKKDGALAYRAERNATGRIERGTATVERGSLVLARENLMETYALRESGSHVSLSAADSTDVDDYVKETTPPPSPPAPPLSIAPTFVRIDDGRVYALHVVPDRAQPRFDQVVGYVLGPDTGNWTAIADSPRTVFTGGYRTVTTPDGRIVFVAKNSGAARGGVLEFDTRHGTWSHSKPGARRTSFGLGVCPDGSVLAFGGFEMPRLGTQIFDPAPEPVGSVAHSVDGVRGGPGEITDPVVVSTREGIVYIVGGKRGTDWLEQGLTTNNAVDYVTAYDCTRNEYRHVTQLPVPRMYHAATLDAAGRILVFGGVTNHLNHEPIAAAGAYDPRTNTWSSLPEPILPRIGGTSQLGPDGVVWYGGGDTRAGGGGTIIRDAFDPKTGLWTSGLTIPDEK